VSVGLLSERLRRSRVTNLVKTSELLLAQGDGLATFLTTDPRGRQLPDYLSKLADHLATEQCELVKETESLAESVDHIKQIIATQQTYTQAGGVLETVDPKQLLDDAVRMNRAALDRHGVQLVVDYKATPPVNVDKHKVLQILVNLISNAKYAMTEANIERRTLELRLAPDDKEPNYVAIHVIDNGIGIATDDITRIFSHGFSTRRGGHGYGLHSAALAAHELGGNIDAHSDGPGHGAHFVLRLPIDATGIANRIAHNSNPEPAFALAPTQRR
jgi:signal transduction histidine kinase